MRRRVFAVLCSCALFVLPAAADAANVTAAVQGGSLVIKGDADGNEVMIDHLGLLQDQLRVAPGGATTLNGNFNPIVFDGVTGDVRITMGPGPDFVGLTGIVVAGTSP